MKTENNFRQLKYTKLIKMIFSNYSILISMNSPGCQPSLEFIPKIS